MGNNPPTSDASLAELILLYLEQRPAAQDTADGVWRWWIPSMGVERAQVQAALDLLCRQGHLWSAPTPDGFTRDGRRDDGGNAAQPLAR